jgi:hypothetical protein
VRAIIISRIFFSTSGVVSVIDALFQKISEPKLTCPLSQIRIIVAGF